VTVINTSDHDTDQRIIDLLLGWTVCVDGQDMVVQGSDLDEHGFVTLVGLPLDDDGNPISDDTVAIRFDDAVIEVY
jgi:hypothetical protein